MPVPLTPAVATPPGAPLASAWGTHARPDELLRALDGAKARITVRPAGDPAWGSVAGTSLAALQHHAVLERGTAWPQPLVSHYARYFRDGNRTAYEDLVAARQQRLTRAVVMALTAADRNEADEWLDDVVDGAYLLCEQSSWSWAAHDDVFRCSGDVVPDRGRPFLDLGAGEVAAQLAWLDHVLGAGLDSRAPGLRRRLREETHQRVIRPFLERLDWHWLGLDGDVHNWNPWIHSNLIAAALFLVDDPRLQARVLARCIEGLDRFLASIPADGAIDEGFAYWWNGAGRALEGLALLEEATAGVLGAGLPVIRELVAFPHRMHVGGTWFLNVADGPARAAAALPWDMLHRWALRLGDDDAARQAASMIAGAPDAAAGLGRVLHTLFRSAPPSEHHQGVQGSFPLVPFTYLPSVQVMVARETAGSTRGLLLAAKGGHNGEHHNHRDVGSVVVAVDGTPLLVDAGQPTYTAKTFGPDRYDIRAMQSTWHNVPAPFGMEQGTGSGFAAEVLELPTAEQPGLQLALGAAYGLRPHQWIRTSTLDRATGRVIIADRWDFPAGPHSGGSRTSAPDGPASDVDITFLAAGTVRVGPGGSAAVHPAGIPGTDSGRAGNTARGAALRWEPGSAVVLVDEWHLEDPLLSAVWGSKLTRLRFRAPTSPGTPGAFTLTVEATP
ncbi:heparinase [Pseudarthrobacter sp. NPDC058196]|uniref:heparinase n=1 Tax=Pseudarthrobacter sp. NPDC058196 TaxID=3346376 RepID=UPI0036DA4CC0